MTTPSREATEKAKKIADALFYESCDHADDGQCDSCIKEYLPKHIAQALSEAHAAGYAEAREDALQIGAKDCTADSLPECHRRYVKAIKALTPKAEGE